MQWRLLGIIINCNVYDSKRLSTTYIHQYRTLKIDCIMYLKWNALQQLEKITQPYVYG